MPIVQKSVVMKVYDFLFLFSVLMCVTVNIPVDF